MAVTFDAVGPSSAGQSGAAVTSLSWTHTVAAGPAAVTAGASAAISPPATISATCGGTAMTQLGSVKNGGSTGAGQTCLFGLANVAAGAATMALTSSATSDMEGGSLSYAGADTGAPFGTAVTNAGDGVTAGQLAPTGTVAGTAATSMVTAAAGQGSSFGTGSGVVTTGTFRWVNDQNSSSGGGNGAGGDTAGGGAGTVAFNGASDWWGWVGAEIRVAGAGGGSTSGPNSPSTGTDLGGGTGSWTSPGGITAAGGTAATWAVT